MISKFMGFVLVGSIVTGCGALGNVQDAIKAGEAKVERVGKIKSIAALMGTSQAPTKAEMPDQSTMPTTTSTSPSASFLTADADKACEVVNRNACLDENANTCAIGVVWTACTDPEINGAALFEAATTPTSADFAVQFTDVTIGSGDVKVGINGKVTVAVTAKDKKLETFTVKGDASFKYNDGGERTVEPKSTFSWVESTQVMNYTANYTWEGKEYAATLENVTFAESCDGVVSGKITLKEGAESFVINVTSCGKGTYTNKNGTFDDVDGKEVVVFKAFRPGKKVFIVEFE